jgi:murein endopeptidase
LAQVAAQPGLFFLSGGAGQQRGNQAWCDNHTNNHYLSPAVLQHVESFATSVSQLTGGKILVGLDDMSLVRGGIFDLDGDFESPHVLHRQGHDVDVAWVQVVNTGAFLSAHLYEADIQQAAKTTGGKRVIEGPIHFRFPF